MPNGSFERPIHAQRNEYIRMDQPRLSESGNEYEDDLIPELGRRRRAAWGAYKSIEDVVKKTRNTWSRAHLFNTTVLPTFTYASETWAVRRKTKRGERH
ncbi:hypothetical protein RB195_024787 [Necator americanus]